MVDKWWTNGINFTKSEKIRFINLVKERPGLWNYKLTFQHKYQKTQECIDLKTKLWHEIVDIYGGENLTGEERDNLSDLLQRKWRNLRDSYVKVFKGDNEKYKRDPLYLTFSSFLDEITMENMRVRSNYRWREGEGVVRGGRGRGRRKGKQDKEKSFEDDEGNRFREMNGDNEKSFEDDEGNRCREMNGDNEKSFEDDEGMRCREMNGDNEKSFEDDEGNRCREINGDNEKSFEDDRCREIDAPIELDLNAEDYPFDTMLDDSNGAHLETSSSAPDCSAFTLQQTQSAVDLDECDIFGQFIAVKLRKMNPQTRSRMQFLIHQTIFNDENNRNDNQVNSKQN